MKLSRIKNLTLISALFLGFFLTFPISKIEALSVSPVRLEITGDPGQTLVHEMTLTNDTGVSQIFYSSFANFEAQGETGNPAFVESKNGLDKWMSTEESVALPPGGSLIVPITIRIPNDADAGGHFAAIFWGTYPSKSGDSSLSIGAKVGMLVLLSVKGDIKEGGGLLDFSTKDNKFWYNTLPVSFEYRFNNDGGDRIKPIGKAKIRNNFFIPVDKINANPTEGNILPNSVRRFEFDWIKYSNPKNFVYSENIFNNFFEVSWYQFRNFAVGLYSAKLDIIYGISEMEASKTVYFFVFPWQMLICLLVIILVVFFVGRKLIRRYNKYIIKKASLSL